MSTALGAFLARLGEDPEFRDRYIKDADSVLAESGLSEDDARLVRSGDAVAIRSALGAITEQWTAIVVMVATSGGGDDDD